MNKIGPSNNIGIIQISTIQEITKVLIKACSESSILLVGSYVQNNATSKSDLDIFMVVDEKILDSIVEIVTNNMTNLDKCLMKKLDCKIITNQKLSHYRNTQYLMLYSMINYGKLVYGKPIKVDFDLDKLKNDLDRLVDELDDVNNLFIQKYSCEIISKYLFSLGKSFTYLNKIINPSSSCSLKHIWKNNLFYLGSLYEKNQSKGISTSFNIVVTGKKQKNADYKRIKACYEQLKDYGSLINKNFLDHYKIHQ